MFIFFYHLFFPPTVWRKEPFNWHLRYYLTWSDSPAIIIKQNVLVLSTNMYGIEQPEVTFWPWICNSILVLLSLTFGAIYHDTITTLIFVIPPHSVPEMVMGHAKQVIICIRKTWFELYKLATWKQLKWFVTFVTMVREKC